MTLQFSKASEAQFDSLCALYQTAIDGMHARGMDHWEWEVYPNPDLLSEDIADGRLYLVHAGDALCGAFALSDELEEEYSRIEWQYGVHPATIHRAVMLPEHFGADAAALLLDFVKAEAARKGCDSLRLDIVGTDAVMLAACASGMAREAGRMFFERFGVDSVCFEASLTADCPLLPVRMLPAYRHGDMTPWGGDRLRTVYGRSIPDDRTGEALEVSTIPGLESRTEQGETLTELIRRNGARLTGDAAGGPFPLLLKLLDAKDRLSVQVHPDDAYAAEHEHKLGKTEAWVILRAEEGAQILYGLKGGVTLTELREKLEAGADIEPLIARADVHPGDVFYMPAGMVHSLSGGILLYEIQQSSDVTYRLWDFDRVNAAGEKRPLHIRQSLDVIRPELTGLRTAMPPQGANDIVNLLSVPAFRLDCLCVNGELPLDPQPHTFRLITALAGLLLSWEGDALELSAGDTVLLPAACPPVTLMGVGRALQGYVGDDGQR